MTAFSVFVYGTLKRGEERCPRWPQEPLRVESGRIRGRLYDLGPYPALLPGDDWVGGELWTLDAVHRDQTLRVLDEIECCGVDDVDLYIRRTVACWIEPAAGGSRSVEAEVYYLADETQVAQLTPIAPDANGICHWWPRSKP